MPKIALLDIAPATYRTAAEMTAEKEGCTVEEAERIGRIATRFHLSLLALVNGPADQRRAAGVR